MTPFNPGEAAEFAGPHTAKRVMSLLFHDGIPQEEGPKTSVKPCSKPSFPGEANRKTLDQKTVRELFDYNPESGVLAWKKARSRSLKVGQEAGTLNKNQIGKAYRRVGLKGFGRLLSHRIVWCWVTGHFPKGGEEIDHIDGNGLNNRWDNLRLVNSLEQSKNRRLPKNNKTGAIGVSFNKARGKYQADIMANGQRHHLGLFAHLKDAVAARQAASKKFGFHVNHGQTNQMILIFHEGMPENDGWYLVELEEDSADLLSMPFRVVYCRSIAVAPGGVGYEWVGLAPRHIKRWAKLP